VHYNEMLGSNYSVTHGSVPKEWNETLSGGWEGHMI